MSTASRVNKPRLLASVAILTATVLPATARAGNDDAVPVGNDAALMGQAAVANSRGSAAAFYNPAALGQLEQPTADLSGSAFHLRFLESPDVFDLGGRQDSVSDVDIVSIPSAVGFARPLGPDLRLGLGVYVPQMEDSTLNLDEQVSEGDVQEVLTSVFAEESSVFRAVAALAWRPAPRLWLGASLRIGYVSSANSAEIRALRRTPGSEDLLIFEERISYQLVSATAMIGAFWRPLDELALAVTAVAPDVALGVFGSAKVATGGTTPGGLALEVVQEDFGEATFDAIGSPVFRAGAEWQPGPAFRLAVDADIAPSLANERYQIDRELVWNVRVGVEGRVSPNFWIGGGAFTDRSALRNELGVAQTRLDFVGATAGVRWESRYTLGEDEDAPEVTFGTVIAVRYAYGYGNIGGFAIDVDGVAERALLTREASASQHELGLHLGGWTAF